MPFGKAFVYQAPKRKKSEVSWTALTGPAAVLAADTNVDLIAWLNALPAPQSGTLAPFFNTTSSKLNAFNSNDTLTFKLNLVGSWSGGSAQRSMQLDFIGTNGNRLVESRDVQVTEDVITLTAPLSIDAGGYIATNGTKPVIRSNNGSFTATAVLLIAEQATRQTLISAV